MSAIIMEKGSKIDSVHAKKFKISKKFGVQKC
jgi:hypothetical protein